MTVLLWSLNRHHHTHAAVVMASRGSFWKAAGDQWDLFLDFQARHRTRVEDKAEEVATKNS